MYVNLAAALIPKELNKLEYHAQNLASGLDNYVRESRVDVLAMADDFAVREIARAGAAGDRAGEANWRKVLTQNLVAQLEAKTHYVQYRLIGVADGGREIIRVDRSGINGAIRVVPEEDLQRKGDRDYFREAIRLSADKVYFSPIELNQENGVVEKPYLPVLRAATPVMTPDGKTFGIIIINIDMRPAFTAIKHSLSGNGQIYLVNERGDYLVHPDSSREFGFDLGRPVNVRDEFPGFEGILSSGQSVAKVFDDPRLGSFGAALIPNRLADEVKVVLIETMPPEELYAATYAIRRSMLIGGIIAVLSAALLAFLLARSLTKPLVKMTGAVSAFTGTETIDVPTGKGGEIGVLAAAFEKMGGEVRKKTEALQREIEERRRIEKEKDRYAERDRLYGAVVRFSNDAILTKTLDGTITGWNQAAEDLYGYTSEEAIGKNIKIIVPPEKKEELEEILEKICLGKHIENFETVRADKNGKRIDVSLTISPVKSPTGKILGASTIARDITGQKRAEEKFRLAVDSSPSGVVMVNGEGEIVLVNKETERMFGYEKEKLIGAPIETLVPERFRKAHPAFRREYSSAPAARRMGQGRDLFGVKRNGSEFPIEIGLNPLETGEGMLILGTIVDITERKLAEDALKKSEERFSKAFRSSPDAIVISRLSDGTIIDVNEKWSELYGYRAEELINRSSLALNLFSDPEDRKRLIDLLEEQGVVRDFELDIRNKKGETRNTLVSMEKIELDAQLCLLSSVRDITELKRAEQELVTSREQLRSLSARINQAIEEESKRIAADVHDLIGGDLVGLKHNVETLRQLLKDKSHEPVIGLVREKLGEMEDMMTATLNTAKRISSELHPAELDFLGLVPALKSEGQRFCERTKIECRFDFYVEDSSVTSEQATAVFRVFQEALRNVFRHAEATEITVRVMEEDGKFILKVMDNGRGITNTERNAADSLGLLGMRERVSRVNGKVKISGITGMGTTVSVLIPLQKNNGGAD